MSDDVTMKPLLGILVQEAVTLALIDSIVPPVDDAHPYGLLTDDERLAFRRNVHSIPSEWIAAMDPMALAQNVACRLLGTGGWSIGDLYAPNATPREVLEATLERPDRSYVDEIAFDVTKAMRRAHEDADEDGDTT